MDEPIKTGEAKIAQMKQWSRYFKFSREGNKIIIEEVYSTPKPAIVKRNNVIGYIDHIEKLLLDLLVQDQNNGQVFLSKNKLMQELNMINSNYSYAKQHIPELSAFMNICELDIQEFYESTNETLKRSLENALNKLKSKSLVFWSYAMTVCIVDINVTYNELNNIKATQYVKGSDTQGNRVYGFKIYYRAAREYREATKDEYRLIVRTERDVMKNLNCKNKQEVVKFGKWEEFTNKVKEILLNKGNILFYYDSYKVLFNEEHIYEEWYELEKYILGDSERNKHRITLNSEISNRLINNAKKRQANANKNIDLHKENENLNRRSESEYIENNKKLVDTLINHEHQDIRKDIDNRFNF